jgi:hypothetical protein
MRKLAKLNHLLFLCDFIVLYCLIYQKRWYTVFYKIKQCKQQNSIQIMKPYFI